MGNGRRVALLASGLAATTLAACTTATPGRGAPDPTYLASASAGPNAGPSAGPGQADPVLTFGLSGSMPTDLHPLAPDYGSSGAEEILTGILPTPFQVDDGHTLDWNDQLLALEPESTVSGGTQTVTYEIDPAAQWSDGTPVTAADFRYTWQVHICQPADPLEPIGVAYHGISAVDGDGSTATVHFATPSANWPALFQLLPAHLLDTGDPAQNCAAADAGWPIESGLPEDISAGPWQLLREDIDPGGDRVTLTPNPQWWSDPPKLDGVELVAVADPFALAMAMSAGDIDATQPWFEPQLASDLQGQEPDLTVDVEAGLVFEHLDFNTRNPHLAVEAVRQAIALSLDRPMLLDLALGPGGAEDVEIVDNRFWVPGQPAYSDTSGGDYDSAHPDEAADLLEQAGYAEGADGIYAKDGQPLQLRLLTPPDPVREQIAITLADQLADAGISVEPETSPTFYGEPGEPGSVASGQWDLTVFGWLGSPFVWDKPSTYTTSTKDAPKFNYGLGGLPEVDALLAELAAEPDPDAWADLTDEADELLWDAMFSLPLFQSPEVLAYDPAYAGLSLNPSAPALWNADDWRVS